LLLLKVSSGRFPGFWRGRQESIGKRRARRADRDRVGAEHVEDVAGKQRPSVFGKFAAD
jgi:hypothetical protein